MIISAFSVVGMTRFELATTRPPDVYSNRAELHPVLFASAKIGIFRHKDNFSAKMNKNEKKFYFRATK